MRGVLTLTPDELASLVSAVMEYNNYQAEGLALYSKDVLIGYDRVEILFSLKPLKVRTQPEEQSPTAAVARLRSILYPDAPSGDGQ